MDDVCMDNKWIIDFEKNDKLYEDFYKDNLYFTKLHFIYINTTNCIEKIVEESFIMSIPNCITHEELIKILKKRKIDNNIKYSLLSILKYNITLDVEDINIFLKNTHQLNSYNFLSIIKKIDTIKFDKSINMFHDLNDLIFIFYENPKEIIHNLTKKIHIKTNKKNTHKNK
jgi:hypothetical protein